MLPNISDPASDYGLPKRNYKEVVDPTTEFDQSQIEALCVDVAALTQTACRAWVIVDTDGTLLAHSAVWGSTNAVAPTVTRNSAGNYTVQWAAGYYDLNPTVDRRVFRAPNIQLTKVGLQAVTGGASAIEAVGVVTDTRTVTVHILVGGVYTDKKFGLWVY